MVFGCFFVKLCLAVTLLQNKFKILFNIARVSRGWAFVSYIGYTIIWLVL